VKWFAWLNKSVPALIAFCVGCATPNLPPSVLSEQGWHVREIPVVWKPTRAGEEMIGELLSARHDDGSLYVQFSKGGIPIVVARQTAEGWEIHSSLGNGTSGGRGQPPDSVMWFQLGELPPTAPSGPWRVENFPDGAWRMLQPKTGELIEGSSAP
jgi:hypothetical protein